MRINVLNTLPEGYSVINRIHKKKHKKPYTGVIIIDAFIMCVMAYIMNTYFIPIQTYFNSIENTQEHIWAYILVVLFVCLYAIIHEIIHGLFMKFYGVKKVFYTYSGILAYAGSNEYIPKRYYIIITIAPFIILGIILLIINIIVNMKYFWLVYSIQLINIAYAIADIYVILLLKKTPQDTLISDDNSSRCFYSRLSSIENLNT